MSVHFEKLKKLLSKILREKKLQDVIFCIEQCKIEEPVSRQAERLVMQKIAETDIEYYKSCEKIVLAIIERMPLTVFSRIDIDAEFVKTVYRENGFSFNTIEKFFH